MKPEFFIVLFLVNFAQNCQHVDFQYAWRSVQYQYENQIQLRADLRSRAFIPANVAPIDVEPIYRPTGRDVFVTMPRFLDGIPATLALVANYSLNGQEVLIPYPNWQMQRLENGCQSNRLISVFRTKVDGCGRLWVLDSGFIGNGSGVVCHPQILTFDLNNNEVVHRFEFPPGSYDRESTVLITPIIEEMDTWCNHVFVYMADVGSGYIYVYNSARSQVWRVKDDSMNFIPQFSNYEIAGYYFQINDSIFGMDLSPPGQNRRLFFHPLSANTQSWVYTRDLQNSQRFSQSANSAPEIFHTVTVKGVSQAASMAINQDGITFFNFVTEYTFNCWNIRTAYSRNNIGVLYQSVENMQFASGVKIVRNPWTGLEEIWFLTSRYQRIATQSLDLTDVNFRIMSASTRQLLQGSRCLIF